MTDKVLLLRSEHFRSHVYEPGVPKEQMQKQIVGDLLKRVFDSSAKRLVVGALGAKPASAKKFAEIRDMIDKLEKKRRGSK